MRTICRTLALHPQIWWHRIEPFALPAELQAHFYELFEGEPRGSRMRYNTIAKTVPLALPAELQALIDFFGGIDANHPPDVCATSPKIWGHRFEPFALPAELQALIDFFGGIDANHLPDACATSPNLGA